MVVVCHGGFNRWWSRQSKLLHVVHVQTGVTHDRHPVGEWLVPAKFHVLKASRNHGEELLSGSLMGRETFTINMSLVAPSVS